MLMLKIYYVGLWLVARFAIVAFFTNYSETHVLFGGFTFVAKKNGIAFFFGKKLQLLQVLQILQVLQVLQVLEVPQVHPQNTALIRFQL